MTEKGDAEISNRSTVQEMGPLFSPTFGGVNGLDCLRMVDSLYIKQLPSLSEILFGIASESKFDIFNDKHERMFQALESKFILILRRKMCLWIFEKHRHSGNVSVVQQDDVLHFVLRTISIKILFS
jgi:hypothetical protein